MAALAEAEFGRFLLTSGGRRIETIKRVQQGLITGRFVRGEHRTVVHLVMLPFGGGQSWTVQWPTIGDWCCSCDDSWPRCKVASGPLGLSGSVQQWQWADTSSFRILACQFTFASLAHSVAPSKHSQSSLITRR